jgi:hypothetical protein
VKKLIILLAFILPFCCYCQEVYLLKTIESQKPFNIQRCTETVSVKYQDQKWLIKLNYDKDKDELSWSYYKPIGPPYEGKSLFENESKKMVIPIKDLKRKKLTIEEVLNSPASAGKIFSTTLSNQQQWNDGVTWSFMQPYESDGENIPTLSFKKTK